MKERHEDETTPKMWKMGEEKTAPKEPANAEGSFDFDLEAPPLAKPIERLERLPPGPTIEQTVEEYVEENPPEKKTILNPNALMSALLEAKRKENKDK